MPKMKSHRGVRKRIRITATGKVLRGQGFHSHLMTGKSGKRRRRLRRRIVAVGTEAEKLLLMYGKP